MLDEFETPAAFWDEAAFTIITILNKANFQVNSNQTPYELWYGKPSTVKHLRVFGRKCFIKNTDEKLCKFKPRADKRILLGYSSRSKQYKCYNKRLWKIVESIDVVIDEACRNLEQMKSTKEYDSEEVGEFFRTSNQNDIEEETHEATKEDTTDIKESIQVCSKESSRISNSRRKGGWCTDKKNSYRDLKLSSITIFHQTS